MSTLTCYSPADSADYADECSKAALFRRERQIGMVYVFLGFGVLSALISEICGRHWGFICADRLSTLACYSPADSADHADECSKAALFRRERQVGVVYVFLGFGVLSA